MFELMISTFSAAHQLRATKSYKNFMVTTGRSGIHSCGKAERNDIAIGSMN
jgi:hypothetical protein